MPFIVILIISIVFSPAAAFGADGSLRPEPVEGVDLGEVLVQTEAEPSLDEAAQATLIVPEKDAPLATSTVQMLEQTVGVTARRYGGIDDFSALSLRGSTPGQVQIYMDDVPLVTAQGALTDLNIIPMNALEAVEVYRGGSPGTIPESSIGGVVVLRSKARPEEFEWTVNGGYGSFGTLRLGVGQAQPIGKFSYRFVYDYYRSRGDFTYRDDQGTTFNPNDDQLVKRQNNAFVQNAFFSKFDYELSRDWRIEFVDSFLNKGQGIPGIGSRKSLNAHLTTWRNIAAINVVKEATGEQNIEAAFNLFFDFLNSEFSDPDGEIGLGPQRNDDDTYRFGETARIAYDWGRHQFITGMLAHRSEFYLPHTTLGATIAGSESNRHSIAVGLEDEIVLLNERLFIVPSVRFESTFNNLRDDVSGVRNDSTDNEFSAKLGLKARLVDGLYFKGNVYRGFRQPTFTELFGDRGALVGNPNLKPEKAFNFDAGLVYNAPELSWLSGGRIEVAYFQNDMKDLIQFLQTSQFVAKAQNLNDALVRGVETSARATFFDRLSAAANYTWQRAKDTSNTVTEGKYLPGRPKHTVGAMLAWREEWHKDFVTQMMAGLNYESGSFLDTQNLLQIKHRAIVTAGLSLEIINRIKASFTARNITNDRTVDAVGYPLPGRSYWGNVEIQL